MSKTNKENARLKIEAQIDSLFDDISEDSKSIATLSVDSSLPGWEWESDLTGTYTKCGESIQQYLGVDPSEAIGEKISSFSVAVNSILPIENIITSNRYPADVFAQYLKSNAEMITVHLKIYQKYNDRGEPVGLHGFSQIINLTDSRSIAEDKRLTPTTFDEPKISAANPQMQHIYDDAKKSQAQSLDDLYETGTLLHPFENSQAQDKRTAFDELLSTFISDSEDIDMDFLIEKIRQNQGTEVLLSLIDNDPNREWTNDEILVVEQVAEQLSLALENAELFQQTQSALASSDEQTRRLALLNELNRLIAENPSIDEINRIAAQITKQIYNADHVSVLIPTENETIFRCFISLGDEAIVREAGLVTVNGFANAACLQAENNIAILNQSTNLGQTIQSMMSGHIHLYNDTFCVLNVGMRKKSPFTSEDETIFQQIVNLLISSYQNRNLITEIGYALNSAEEQSRRLGLLNELADSLGQSNEIEDIINSFAEKAMQMFSPTQTKVSLLDTNDELIVYANLGEITHPNIGEIQSKQMGIQQCLLNGEMNQTIAREFDEEPFYSTINAPLYSGEEIVGVITLNDFSVEKFNQSDINILSQMLSLVSSTVENINLFNQIRRRSNQLQTTAEVSQRASRTLDIDELIEETLGLIQSGFDFIHTSIFLLDKNDKNKINLHTQINKTEDLLTFPHILTISDDKNLSSARESLQPLAHICSENTLLYQHPDSISLLILPLTSLEELSGYLIVQSDQIKNWSQEDISTLSTMSDQLSSSIDNARLYLNAQQKADQERIVREISETLSRASGYAGVMQSTLEELFKLIQANKIVIHIGTKEQLLRFKKADSELPSIHITE